MRGLEKCATNVAWRGRAIFAESIKDGSVRSSLQLYLILYVPLLLQPLQLHFTPYGSQRARFGELKQIDRQMNGHADKRQAGVLPEHRYLLSYSVR